MVFADGACSGNPGPGGWGTVISDGQHVLELGGFDANTTNNRMELEAVFRALENIRSRKNELPISIYTDSKYVIHGITQWISGWKKNSWKTAAKEEVKNKDLWIKLDDVFSSLKKICTIEWNHVDGHSGIPGNERVDEIASSFSKHEEIDLYDGDLKNYNVDLSNLEISNRPAKKKSKSKTGEKVFYLSLVNGKVFRDETWKACEARVKNQRGAKFKKFSTLEEERAILNTWKIP
ncbi:MAG: ribonuclease HI [Deltaproteobacteria bacterium]|nr:ribonuclease HI [Deltaproteobacteria bacterium]